MPGHCANRAGPATLRFHPLLQLRHGDRSNQATLALNDGLTPTGGELQFGLRSPTSYGAMSISGNATLGGTVA